MSTIRPLATIAVLAALGVYLALEINKQGPVSLDSAWETAETPAIGSEDAPAFEAADSAPTFESSLTARSAPTSEAEAPAYTPAVETAPVAVPTPSPAEPPQFSSLPALPAIQGGTDLPPSDPASSNSVANTPPVVETSTGTTLDKSTVQASAVTPYEASETTPLNFGAAAPVAAPTGFAAAWQSIEQSLARNDLAGALKTASEWRANETLSLAESDQLKNLLSELAGTVVYSMEHRLEPPYTVRAGETLETIAKQYEVPWQLLAKINGVSNSDGVQPGQQIKVIRGPFDAEVVLSSSELVLTLDDQYAGRFPVQIDGMVNSASTWRVDQKQLTPIGFTTGRLIVLRNEQGATITLSDTRQTAATHQAQLRVASNDATDLYDILSIGSVVKVLR